MKNIRKVWSNLTSKEEEQSAVAAAKSLHSEMFKSMGSLGSMLTLTTRASSKEEEVWSFSHLQRSQDMRNESVHTQYR